MQKRGSIWNSKKSTIAISKLLLAFFEFVLVVTVYLMLLSQISALKNHVAFEELYLSRDLAFLIDTIYAAPDSINYEYSIENFNLGKFIFNFKDQKVDVNWEGAKSDYPYAQDNSIGLNANQVHNPNKIVIEKNKERLEIRK